MANIAGNNAQNGAKSVSTPGRRGRNRPGDISSDTVPGNGCGTDLRRRRAPEGHSHKLYCNECLTETRRRRSAERTTIKVQKGWRPQRSDSQSRIETTQVLLEKRELQQECTSLGNSHTDGNCSLEGMDSCWGGDCGNNWDYSRRPKSFEQLAVKALYGIATSGLGILLNEVAMMDCESEQRQEGIPSCWTRLLLLLGIMALSCILIELWYDTNYDHKDHVYVLKVQKQRISRRGRLACNNSKHLAWCLIWIITCQHAEGHWRFLQAHADNLIGNPGTGPSLFQREASIRNWWTTIPADGEPAQDLDPGGLTQQTWISGREWIQRTGLQIEDDQNLTCPEGCVLHILDALGRERNIVDFTTRTRAEGYAKLTSCVAQIPQGHFATDEDRPGLCITKTTTPAHSILHFGHEMEIPLLVKLYDDVQLQRHWKAVVLQNPVVKENLLRELELLATCDLPFIQCDVQIGENTLTRWNSYDTSVFASPCDIAEVYIHDSNDYCWKRLPHDDQRTHKFKEDQEDVSTMQTNRPRRRIIRLWGMSWRDVHAMHWHTWSHLEGQDLDAFHLPDLHINTYNMVDIQGKNGMEKIVYDSRITTPIFMEISCIESSHRGVLSWERMQRGRTPYAFVLRLCRDIDLAYDWTCWAEDPRHLECGADIVANAGMHIKVFQRQLAEPTDSESTDMGTSDLEDINENEQTDYETCSLFQRTFIGSAHEGLDWAIRDVPQGEWANRMEDNFLADVQYLREVVSIQPGHKHIRIVRSEDGPLWETHTLSWEVQQASPLRMMQDMQATWIDMRRYREWTLTQIDTVSSAVYALEEMIFVLEVDMGRPFNHRHRPHLIERIAVHGSSIRVNAVIKKIQFPATKRSLIESSEVARCSQLYACEVWVNSQKITHMESLLVTEPSLIQVVRTLGGETIPLLEGNMVPSIPVGHVRLFPLQEYRLLRHYGHPWHVILFRDTLRAEPAHINCDLQIHQQPETLVATAFTYWPTLRITDWSMVDADYAAFGSVVLNNYDAISLILELHAGHPEQVLLLLEKRTMTEDGEHAIVLAHRLFHEVRPQDISFALDAEAQCDSEDFSCEVYCNGNYIASHEIHRASNGDFCTLQIERIRKPQICSHTKDDPKETNLIRLRSRSPRQDEPSHTRARRGHHYPSHRGTSPRRQTRTMLVQAWNNTHRQVSALGWAQTPPPGNGRNVTFKETVAWIFPEGTSMHAPNRGILETNPFWVQAFMTDDIQSINFDHQETKENRPTLPSSKARAQGKGRFGNVFLDDFYSQWDSNATGKHNPFVRNYHLAMEALHDADERWLHFTMTSTLPAGQVLWHPGGYYELDTGQESSVLLAAGFNLFHLTYRGHTIYCVGDKTSEVVPVIFREAMEDKMTSIRYCSIHSTAKELVRTFFPKHTTGDDSVIWKAGQEIILNQLFRTDISLDELIPEPKTTILELTEVARLHEQLKTPILPAKVFTDVIEWHPSTEHHLSHLSIWPDGQMELPERYEFYTDGTAKGNTNGAAAVVCIARRNGRWYWMGTRAVEQFSDTTSNRMEASALLVALLWAHDQISQHETSNSFAEIGFYYDSMISGNVASGIWTPVKNKDLQEANRGLVHWLQERRPVKWIEWHHTPAHAGNPWNEAADTVANAISTGLLQAPPVQCIVDQMEPRNMIEWLWYWERVRWSPDLRFSSRGPKLLSHNFSEPKQTMEHPIQGHLSNQEETETLKGDYTTLKLGTANVLTLFPNRRDGELATGRYISARMESLIRQFDRTGYHVIGLQETRSKMQGHQVVEPFHILSHPASKKGHGGVQIWIRKSWQTTEGLLKISRDNLQILHSEEEILIVKLHKGPLRFLLVTAHAPSSQKPDQGEVFWKHLTEQISNTYQRWPIIIFVDANARLGEGSSERIGPITEDVENAAGKIFRQWIETSRLTPPSTWRCHQGPTFTWTNSTGEKTSRLDYILVRDCHLPLVQRSWTDPEIDLAVQRPDHHVAAIQMSWPCNVMNKKGGTQAHRIPAHLFRQWLPEVIQAGYRADIMQHLTKDNRMLDVHDHAQTLTTGLKTVQQMISTPSPKPRKAHMTDATWALVLERREQWRNLRYLRHQEKRLILGACWTGWKQMIGKQSFSSNPTQWKKQIPFAIAETLIAYKRLSNTVVQALREDDKNFYEELAHKARDAEGDSGFLWKYVKPLLLKNTQARAHNTRCRGPSSEELHAHFDKLEAAERVDYDILLAHCRARQQEELQEMPMYHQLTTLPTRLEIEQLCRQVQPDKAPGCDHIEGGLLKYGADLVGPDLHSIFMKAWITGCEPLQWKGGLLVPIWKRKGSSRDASTYRGSTLLDGTAKRWHAFLRKRFMASIICDRPLGQLGGFPQQQTGFASLYMRSLGNVTKAMGLPEAYLFVDVIGAFHYLIREAAFHMDTKSDDSLRKSLLQEGIDFDLLCDQARLGMASTRWASLPPELRRALQDAHDHTWTSLASKDGILTRTRRGTRPGSPIADIAFNYYMGHIIRDLQQCIDEDEDLKSISATLGIPLRVIAWVDDLMIPLVSTDNTLLMQLLCRYTWLTKEVLQRHGLLINFGKGKTEAVIMFRKENAPAWREQVFVENKGCWTFEDPEGIPLKLFVVPTYKHLRARHAQNGDFSHEIKHRLQEATGAFRQMRRIFAYPHLAIPAKLRLLDALILSRLFFNSGYWPKLSCEMATKVNHQVIKWQRYLVKADYLISDAQLRAMWNLLSLEERLSRNRILTAFKVAEHSYHLAWQAADVSEEYDKGSWLRMVRTGLHWMDHLDPNLELEGVMHWTAHQMHQWLMAHKNTGPKRIRQLVWKHQLQEGTMTEVYWACIIWCWIRWRKKAFASTGGKKNRT